LQTRQLILSGTLSVTPPSVVGTPTSSFPFGFIPKGTSQIPLATTPSPKQSVKMSGGNKSVASPGAFQTISGLGATDDVTTADTVYIESDAIMQIQITQQNPAGGSPIVSVVNLYGTMWIEFPATGYATGLAAQGTGNLEVLISGPA
jgi:hypothetical protein